MFSKAGSKRIFILAPFVTALFLTGCSRENENSSPPPVIKLEGESTQCLRNIRSTFADYVEGKLPESELVAFWNCLQSAVDLFMRRVDGAQASDSYTPGEIRQFLETHFLGDIKLQQPLVNEFMQLKRLFLSGSADRVTKQELVRTKQILDELNRITRILRPHVKTLQRIFGHVKLQQGLLPFQDELADELTDQQIFNAEQAIYRVGRDLAKLIRASHEDYSFKHLASFIREVNITLNNPSKPTDPDSFTPYIVLLEKIKAVFVNPDVSSEILAEEWPVLMDLAADFLSSAFRLQMYVVGKDWKKGRALVEIDFVAQKIEKVLQGALNRRLEKGLKPRIENSKIVALLTSLRDVGVLPPELKNEGVKQLVDVVLSRFLSNPPEMDEDADVDFGAAQLKQAFIEYRMWYDSQKVIAEQFQSWMDHVPADILEELKRTFGSPWALLSLEDERLLFDFESPLDIKSASQLNLLRAGVRLFVRGYAEEVERRNNLTGLTEAELGHVARDLYPLGEAIGFFSNGDYSRYVRIFLEANLFMPRADGDKLISFEESIEYASFIFSGFAASGIIFSDLKTTCPLTIDEVDTERLDVHCFRSEVEKNLSHFNGHLPYLLRSVNQNQIQWKEIELNLERALRAGDQGRPIARSEILEMWVLLQYVETFFGRFDKDRNQTINLNEALAAFPVYEGVLTDLFSEVLTPEEVRPLFTYMMKYGEPPIGGTSWSNLLRFQHWKWNQNKWQFEATREDVLKILAALNQMI